MRVLDRLCLSLLPRIHWPAPPIPVPSPVNPKPEPFLPPLHRMQKLVDNGPHPPPGETGAKYIIREDGRRINLVYMRAASDRRLEVGDKVGRDQVQGE